MKAYELLFQKIISYCTVIVLFVILLLSISKPSHNQIPWQVFIGTVFTAGLLFLFFLICRLISSKYPFFNSMTFFTVIAILWGVLLLFSGIYCRNLPESFDDYSHCYYLAQELATTGTISDSSYLILHPHNSKCVLLLSGIFRFGLRLGFQDPYYFLLIVNLLGAEATLFSCRYLLLKNHIGERWPQLTLVSIFILCLPIYPFYQTFYTDWASFPVVVCSFALFELTHSKAKKLQYKIAGYFLVGCMIALGAVLKVTSLICIIAVLICSVLLGKLRTAGKEMILPILFIAIGFFTLYFSSELYAGKYTWYTEGKNKGEPAISFVALGLQGDGSYFENRDFKNTLYQLGSAEEMRVYSHNYIKENIKYFWDLNHIVRKIRKNFSSGSFAAGDYSAYSFDPKGNYLKSLFDPYGDLYWYGSKYCIFFVFQIYLILLLRILFVKKADFFLSLLHMSMIGYFLFLLLFEANNRQLFNLLPMLLCGYVVSLRDLTDYFVANCSSKAARFRR